MGYTTDFYGAVEIAPPLNEQEVSFLNDLSNTRRMERRRGPYFVSGAGFMGQDQEEDVVEVNRPPSEQPGLWCQWEPAADGSDIHWDGGEKFYDSADWMKYIIDHFLKPDAVLEQRMKQGWFESNGYPRDERFQHFTFDHVVNGTIEAQGEDVNDHWLLVVQNNVVKVASGVVSFGEPAEI